MAELLDLYLGFDSHFFGTKKRAKNSRCYKKLLLDDQQLLNEILANQKPPYLEEKIRKTLENLMREEPKHTTIIRKTTEGLTITTEDLIKEAGVSLTDDQQNYLNGRVSYHLARLMFPVEYDDKFSHVFGITKSPKNDICKTFGREFIQYLTTMSRPKKKIFPPKWLKFQDIVGNGGSKNAFLFWTAAPYVHLDLKQRGLTANDSAKKVLEWALEAHRDDCQPHEIDGTLKHCYLMSSSVWGGYNNLGYDERMPTHLRSRIYAKEIAEGLCQRV